MFKCHIFWNKPTIRLVCHLFFYDHTQPSASNLTTDKFVTRSNEMCWIITYMYYKVHFTTVIMQNIRKIKLLILHLTTTTTTLLFYSPLSRTNQMSWCQTKHTPTPTHTYHNNQPSFYQLSSCTYYDL